MKTKIGFIGCGWRAHGYMRIIKELGHRMEVSGVFVHSQKSEEKMEQEYPGKIYTDLTRFMEAGHDFVVVLVPREDVLYYLEALMKHQIPILCETPPGNGVEELNACYALKKQYNGKIQVAEQYFLQPYHKAVVGLIDSGKLGSISNMEIAMIHDYHGLSIMRKVLHTGFENAVISAKGYQFPVQFHCGRSGMEPFSDHIVSDRRKRADFTFENGTVGFFDFSDEQYFNYFRTRHMNVRGETGEIYDEKIAYLGEKGVPVFGKLERDDLGQYSNLETFGLRGLLLHGEIVYENPYWKEGARLSDDEIAMAGLLDGMKTFADTGVEIYPLEEALQDTYLYLMMDESIKTGKSVTTVSQSWAVK